MNIYTIRLSKKLMFTAGGILIALILALVLLLSGGDAAPTASMGTLKNKGDQVEYLESLGYTVDQGSMVSKKVTIPKTFDDVYLTYNKMQQDCGFDSSGARYIPPPLMVLCTACVRRTNNPCAQRENTVY